MNIHYVRDFCFLKDWDTAAPAWSGLDIETEVATRTDGWRTGLRPVDTEITTVQIGLKEDVWVVHWDSTVSVADVPGVGLFKDYLTNPVFTKCIHNAVFETSFFLFYLGVVPNKVFCTQLAEYDLAHGRSIICTSPGEFHYEIDTFDNPNWGNPKANKAPGQNLSLGDTVYRRFGVELDKDPVLRTSFKRGSEGSLDSRQLAYAAFDAYYAEKLAKVQADEMDEKTFRVFRLDCENVEAVARQYLNGIYLDTDKLAKLHNAWMQELVGIEDGLRVALWQPPDGQPVLTRTGRHKTVKGIPQYHSLSLRSPEAMPERLRQVGVNVQSFEEDDIKHYKGHPVADAVLRHKKLSTLTARYTGKLPNYVHPDTNRIYSDYKTTITATGRGAVSDPPLQQIPKRHKDGILIRSCFSAPAGHKIIRGDLSMIELRIMAELWDEKNMKRALNERLDLHALTGAAIREQLRSSTWEALRPAYDRLMAELEVGNKYAKDCRQQAKPANFGLGFGAGVARFIKMAWDEYELAWDYETGNMIRTLWHNMYPGIKRRHDFIAESLRVKKVLCIETMEGRRRWVRGFSAALNADVQGTAGDIVKRAQNAICRDIETDMTIHDELVCCVPEHSAEDARVFVKTALINAGQYYLKEVPVDAEVKIQDSWMEAA